MNIKRIVKIAATILVVGAYASSALADNRLVPFQGRLTDGNAQAVNDVERITFVIYDEPTGGTPLWQEIHDEVSIVAGQINVLLGSKSNLGDPNQDGNGNDEVTFTQARYLGITIGADSNQEMVPRHQLVPSFHSRSSDLASDSVLFGGEEPSYYDYRNVMAPIGSIMAWYKDFNGVSITLPSGWVEMNGQTIDDSESPIYAQVGAFVIPDLNGERRFLRGSQIAGTVEEDAMQGHKHNFSGTPGRTGGSGIAFTGETGTGSLSHVFNLGGSANSVDHSHGFTPSGSIAGPVDNGNGTPRQAVETRPVNMSVVWIMRIK